MRKTQKGGIFGLGPLLASIAKPLIGSVVGGIMG